MQLTEQELDFISRLRNGLGVLKEISTEAIPLDATDATHGTVLVTCSDADRFKEIFAFHEKCHGHGRHHPVAGAGGPIAGIWGTSPLLAEEVDIARRFKSIETIVLVAHAPCAMARAEEMSLVDVLEALFKRKEWLKKRFPVYAQRKGGIVCHLHVDDGSKMRTYHVCKEAWYACRDQFLAH